MNEEYTDETPMPFGAHKGKPLEKVPANYLLWLHKNLQPNTPTNRLLLAYIKDNLDVLQKEISEAKNRYE